MENTDIQSLVVEFLKSFQLNGDSVSVTFQRFDEEWDEDVEIDEGDVINDKDELTAIVSPAAGEPGTHDRQNDSPLVRDSLHVRRTCV